jgi:hypothetical protein
MPQVTVSLTNTNQSDPDSLQCMRDAATSCLVKPRPCSWLLCLHMDTLLIGDHNTENLHADNTNIASSCLS